MKPSFLNLFMKKFTRPQQEEMNRLAKQLRAEVACLKFFTLGDPDLKSPSVTLDTGCQGRPFLIFCPLTDQVEGFSVTRTRTDTCCIDREHRSEQFGLSFAPLIPPPTHLSFRGCFSAEESVSPNSIGSTPAHASRHFLYKKMTTA